MFQEFDVGFLSGCVAAAEAGGAGQEGSEREGAAAERAPLPQTPPGAALRVRVPGARPHRQHGLHHLHRLRARLVPLPPDRLTSPSRSEALPTVPRLT